MIRVGGVIFSLPIFSAAGGIMFPTVALASTGVWNDQLGRRARRTLFALSLIIPIKISIDIISDFGWTVSTIGRILLFVCIYVAVVFASHPTITPFSKAGVKSNKLSSKKKLMLFGVILIFVAFFYLGTAGIPGR